MSETFANRLLTKAETGGTAHRCRVGVTSVLRRCGSSRTPVLRGRTVVSPGGARRAAGEALPPRTPPGYFGTDETEGRDTP